jgi:two-component system sensor histidine kinase CreC
LIGLAMAVWLARGIGRLNTYAQAVSAGERAEPPPKRRDEIGDLGRALETMRRKLDGKEYVEGYVQTLTHEMKGPLAAIRGAAELLQEPLPATERERFARNVQNQGERLTEMIDKLLALSVVEQQGWLQKVEPIAAGALSADVAENLSPAARSNGVELVLQQPDAGLSVSGDVFLLRQALLNMGENAIAFAPSSTAIELSASERDGAVHFTVADRGPGVPDYAAARVFERFYSLSRPRSGERSSGLGLPFVREVASLHRGQALLRNREGGGAIAELSLPRR